jgi:guanylate cyclase
MTKNTLRKIVRLLARIGADPSDSDDLRVQKTILVVGVSIGILLLILQGVLYTLFNEPLAGAIPFAYAAVSLGSLVFLGLTRRGFGWFKFSQLVALVLVPFSVTLSLGGLVNSGGPILWGLFGSLSALILHPSRASYWFGASAATIIASLFLQPFLRPANNLPPVFVIVSLGFTLLNVSSFVFVALSYFVGQKNLFQEKSENLLLNMGWFTIWVTVQDGTGEGTGACKKPTFGIR